MWILNLLLVIALLGFVGSGWKDGFVHTAGRLIGSVVGFVLAKSFSIAAGSFLAVLIPSGWARFAAFLIIFILVTEVIGFIFKLADGAFKILSIIPFLKTINSFLGAILGIVVGIILVGGAIWVLVNFDLISSITALLQASWLAKAVLFVFEKLLSILL
ncbi:MAG: CvpA family protein [Patescibacteria group bacterium]